MSGIIQSGIFSELDALEHWFPADNILGSAVPTPLFRAASPNRGTWSPWGS